MFRALLLVLVLGQQPAEMTTRSQSAVFRGGTNEVEVPVVVRDGKGNTVGGLRIEDFRVLDKGKPQAITRFTALEKGGVPASAAVPERFTIFMVNDLFLGGTQLHEALIRHIRTALAPGERAAIMTNSGSYLLDFTGDTGQLAGTVQKVIEAGPKPLPVGLGLSEGHRHMATVQLAALDGAIQRLAVMPGKRTIALASPGFLTHDTMLSPLRPGAPTVYIRSDLGPREDAVIERAVRNRVTINSIDLFALYYDGKVTDPAGIQPYDVLAADHMRRELDFFCRATGGLFFRENNDFDEGLRRVSSPPEHSYLLAFSPQNLKYDGSYHDLKITVPDRKYVDVQARSGYYAPPKLDDPLETAKEELRETLYSRDEIAELPAEMHPGFARLGPDKARVSVPVHIGLDSLHLKKADGRNAADLTVVVGLFDRNGVYVAGKSTDVELRLKDENLAQWMRDGVKIGCNLEVAPGDYLIRLVVRDAEGRALAAHNGAVNIP